MGFLNSKKVKNREKVAKISLVKFPKISQKKRSVTQRRNPYSSIGNSHKTFKNFAKNAPKAIRKNKIDIFGLTKGSRNFIKQEIII